MTMQVKIILLSIAITISIIGTIQDIKKRKFSNNKIAIIISLGVIFAYLSNRLLNGILLFFLMNVIGMVMSRLKILAASDWKFFSTVCFFIPFEQDIKYSIIFILSMLICSFILKVVYTNKGHLKEAFMDEIISLKVFFYTHQWIEYTPDNVVYKSGTTPATFSITTSFIITSLLLVYSLVS